MKKKSAYFFLNKQAVLLIFLAFAVFLTAITIIYSGSFDIRQRAQTYATPKPATYWCPKGSEPVCQGIAAGGNIKNACFTAAGTIGYCSISAGGLCACIPNSGGGNQGGYYSVCYDQGESTCRSMNVCSWDIITRRCLDNCQAIPANECGTYFYMCTSVNNVCSNALSQTSAPPVIRETQCTGRDKNTCSSVLGCGWSSIHSRCELQCDLITDVLVCLTYFPSCQYDFSQKHCFTP